MKNHMLTTAVASVMVLGLGACQVTGDDTADAAITGAGVGAVAGEVLTDDPVAGAAIGAGAGAVTEEVTEDDDDLFDEDDPLKLER